MLEFHEVTAQDAAWAGPLLQGSGYMSCEYSFVNVFMWSHVYNTRIARFGDWVIVRSDAEKSLHYLWPAGKGDEQAERGAVEAILQDAAADGRRLVLYSLSVEAKEKLELWFTGRFDVVAERADFDYIYEQADLAELPGKKYQKKRNHVSRFIRENPDWQFHELTCDAMDEIRQFNNEWCQLYDNRDDEGIQNEHRAIELVFQHCDELGLRGGYITAKGRIVAFSFGSPINDKIFDTNVEKALYDVEGAYNIINREMARNVCAAYPLINREDDVGEEGLRTAKLSYHPAIIEPKYVATLRE